MKSSRVFPVLHFAPDFSCLVFPCTQVRFDADSELDLAVRTSPAPLKITVLRSREQQKSLATAPASMTLDHDVPSTEDYAIASGVSSVASVKDDLMDVNLEADASSDPTKSEENEIEIDGPAAFEVEAAAARDPEGSKLFQKGSIRLAKRYGVHLTPTQLWRVMTLFQIQGRQLVILGLAPGRALRGSAGGASSADMSASSEDDTCDNRDMRRGAKGVYVCGQRALVTSPVQRLLQLHGVEMAEDEVGPMLQALRVRPFRMIRLGLLSKHEVAELFAQEGRSVGGLGGAPFGHSLGRGRGGGRGKGRGRGPPLAHHRHLPHHPMRGPPGGGGRHHPPMFGMPPHCILPMSGGYAHGYRHQPPAHGIGFHGKEFEGGGEWHDLMRGPPPGGFSHAWNEDESGHGRRGGGFRHMHEFAAGCGGGGRGCHGRGGKKSMNMARFVEHRSPSPGNDVTRVVAGQNFQKSWLVRNDSSTPWPEEVSLVPVSRGCEHLSSPQEAAVVGAVAPGEEAEVSVDLIAPLQAGMYDGFWRTFGEGRRFGQRLWAKVLVVRPGDDVGAHVGEDMNAGVKKLSLDD